MRGHLQPTVEDSPRHLDQVQLLLPLHQVDQHGSPRPRHTCAEHLDHAELPDEARIRHLPHLVHAVNLEGLVRLATLHHIRAHHRRCSQKTDTSR